MSDECGALVKLGGDVEGEDPNVGMFKRCVRPKGHEGPHRHSTQLVLSAGPSGKPVGSHGTESLSEASGSAQSEAQKKDSNS